MLSLVLIYTRNPRLLIKRHRKSARRKGRLMNLKKSHARASLEPLTTRQVKWLRPAHDVIYSSRIRVKNLNGLN